MIPFLTSLVVLVLNLAGLGPQSMCAVMYYIPLVGLLATMGDNNVCIKLLSFKKKSRT